ncbi:FxsA family protein [Aneurinibacillus sp. REN35]|uniref:FxsA family protein n=1 Tax=Aneurinibacillus sp. REN35 TaxID=3237286 RepID=UPI003526D93B
MMRILLVVLLVVPILEIWLLIAAGNGIGWIPTLLLCVFTGVAGAWLAKRQGLQIFQLAQMQLNRGQIPGEALLDGICVFAGGLLLLTPGFFSDFLGFFLLIPYTRSIVKLFFKRWLHKRIQTGQLNVFTFNRFNRF